MPAGELPKYEGRLTSPSWSGITLSEALVKSLRAAALQGCLACFGKGYCSDGKTAQVCPCVNRPLGPDEQT
jgi:hypothetical protein